MKIEELEQQAVNAINGGTQMTLVLPKPWKGRPRKFPKGKLMCENNGSNVYSFDPEKVLVFLAANGLASKET